MAGGLGLSAMASPAHAQANCSEFFYNMDGSWSPTHPIVIAGPTSETTVVPSDKFRPGMPGLAGRIGAYLNSRCGNMRMTTGHRIPRVP
ncbi:hypothetical protein [Bradyrhizobium sp. dw_78]|uniref:hypothetical protein n=1 Tax=Bradyrhizobium sp. dw_78 TaxID=2719793 RepID=UPI001BD5A840|nr:hypothetical protein [Bradyrhizobium sp. dw_78]